MRNLYLRSVKYIRGQSIALVTQNDGQWMNMYGSLTLFAMDFLIYLFC